MHEELIFKAGPGAFGDGKHPTTRMMFELLDALQGEPPKNAIDIGCGSGILSLLVAKKWQCPVIASDIDAQSIETTQENAKLNQVKAYITPLQANGFDHEIIKNNKPFDLILMNILAEPLRMLAQDAYDHLATGGILLCSGMLSHEVDAILADYQALGLEYHHKAKLQDWYSLVFSKP